MSAFKRVQCRYTREGQRIGRVVAWRQQCRRIVRVDADVPDSHVLCWQHR